MEISAISNNNFNGYYTDRAQRRRKNNDRELLERIDFQKLADTMDNGNITKVANPYRFLAINLLIAAASGFAAKGASMVALQKMNGKFPLYDLYGKSGKVLNKAIQNYVSKHPKVADAKTAREMFNNFVVKLAKSVVKYGSKGADMQQLQKLQGRLAKTDFLTQRALQKGTAVALGTGTGALTLASRYKDEDGNGIPDKAEKALSTAKQLVELVPAVASAVSLS